MKQDMTKQSFLDKKWAKPIKENFGILVSLIVICIVLSIATSHFFTANNITNVLLQISTNAVIAFGMTYVILLGGIDLSVGSVVALSGIGLVSLMSNSGLDLIPAMLIAIGIGLLVGIVNGFFVTKCNMPAFIVTLSTMMIVRGLALVITSGKPIYVTDERLNYLGNGRIGNVFPLQVVYMLIIFVILFIVLNYTRYGKHLYATGGNKEAARFSGINVDKVSWIAYMIQGTLAGIAGVMTAAKLYSGLPTMGNGAEMDAIAAVVLGGTMMTGGAGTLGGTLIGALIIGVINNGLNLLGVNSYWQDVVKGIIIIFAVYLDIARRLREQKKIKKA